MPTPAAERDRGSQQPETRKFGTVTLEEIASVAGVVITDDVITLGREGFGISVRITSKRDRWEIEERTHVAHLGTHDLRFYAPNVVILNRKEGQVDFIEQGVVRDRQRGDLVYTIMMGNRVGPSFRADGR